MTATTTEPNGFAGPRFTGETSGGLVIDGRLLRLSDGEATFEVAGAADAPRLSEVLTRVRIDSDGFSVLSKNAVVTGIVNTGATYLCQTRMESVVEGGLPHKDVSSNGQLRGLATKWMDHWQSSHRIEQEYKIAVADIENFLAALHHWAEEVERRLPSTSDPGRADVDRHAAGEIAQSASEPLNNLFAAFEKAASQVPEERVGAYSQYAKRLLHPHLLCSPFMYRIFRKPLGYAGDYEMVNMILRDPHEGPTLYARVLNRWMLAQVLAEAHRNRVEYLAEALKQEANRAALGNRPARVFNLGCGPAREISLFAEDSAPSQRASFTLVDFNEETLAYAQSALKTLSQSRSNLHRVKFLKRTAAQVIRSATRQSEDNYDFVYCAGLFDYLTDNACSLLLRAFHDMLDEGGRLLTTNVQSPNPMHGVMTHIFDWHLICRDANDMQKLWDKAAVPCDSRVLVDSTGTNVFLEVRKDAAAC